MAAHEYLTSEKTMPDKLTPVASNPLGEIEDVNPYNEGTHRGLKSRHAQMIALGGTIGTALFVGCGQALVMGGPGFLFASYVLLTVLVFGIITATTEMSSYLPVQGSSVSYYATRFVSPSLGFALGWMYVYIFAITVPAEITATAIVVEYWNPPVHIAVWITLALVIMVLINSFPVGVYGETEFWFASIKVFGVIGMIMMALVLVCGGGPSGEVLGFKYWSNPGAVNEYLVDGDAGLVCAFIGTLTFSVFAFAFAPELLVVTAGEMQSPRRNLPTAGRRYFLRLIIFYVLGVFFVGLIVPSDNNHLLSGGSDASASPWAIAAKDAGITALDSVINVVILTSACSAGSSYLFLSSRALYSLALVGSAPKIFTRCTKHGIPYLAVMTSAAVSLLAYLNCSNSTTEVFNWMVNLINTGAFESWICVCVIYLRFRSATTAQGVSDLPYRSIFQPCAAWFSGVVFLLLLLLSGFKVFISGYWNVSTFLTAYIGLPVFVALYFGHKLVVGRNDPWFIPAGEMDLHSGLAEVLEKETPPRLRTRWYHHLRALFE